MYDTTITYVILILTVVTSIYAWNNNNFLEHTMMKPWMVNHKGQYYRFLTSGFVHLNWSHLIFNMLTFYFMGEPLEMYFDTIPNGGSYFLLLYLMGIIVSDLPTYFKHKENSSYSGLGASGGVSAIVFSYIIIAPLGSLHLMFIPFPIPAVLFGFLYLIYSWYAGKSNRDNINHDAHFWGAIFGIVFTLFLVPEAFLKFVEQMKNFSLF
jgi:membrane associated rhomboid family serine protease